MLLIFWCFLWWWWWWRPQQWQQSGWQIRHDKDDNDKDNRNKDKLNKNHHYKNYHGKDNQNKTDRDNDNHDKHNHNKDNCDHDPHSESKELAFCYSHTHIATYKLNLPRLTLMVSQREGGLGIFFAHLDNVHIWATMYMWWGKSIWETEDLSLVIQAGTAENVSLS